MPAPEFFEITVRQRDPARYEWFLARSGSVIDRGAEPELAFCLVAASLRLAPAAVLRVEYRGVSVGAYTGADLQFDPSAIADRIKAWKAAPP